MRTKRVVAKLIGRREVDHDTDGRRQKIGGTPKKNPGRRSIPPQIPLTAADWINQAKSINPVNRLWAWGEGSSREKTDQEWPDRERSGARGGERCKTGPFRRRNRGQSYDGRGCSPESYEARGPRAPYWLAPAVRASSGPRSTARGSPRYLGRSLVPVRSVAPRANQAMAVESSVE